MSVPSDPTLDESVSATARLWWIPLVVGILFIGFGLMTLFDVAKGASVVALIIGLFLIFDGLVEMFMGRPGGSRVVAVLLGTLLIIGGGFVIAYPEYTIATIAVIWGIVMLVSGIARVVASIMLRDYGWGWRVTLGVIEGIIGVIVLAWPKQTAYVIMILIGIYAILGGILQIAIALALRKAPERLAEARAEGGDAVPAF
jgi:uncharacterized membrane protein HdeD (DUF308 family)